jgi:small subunit ribosomal protein S16
MLAIRLQRTGRSGHAQFRLIVQDSRFSPARSRVVAYVGSYDPHAKTAVIDGEKVSQYLANGAQPSERVALLLQKEGIKLPDWVKVKQPQKRTTRNPNKRRSTRPAEPEAAVEAPQAEAADTEAEEAPEEPVAEAVQQEESPDQAPEPATDPEPAPAEEPAPDAPAEEA